MKKFKLATTIVAMLVVTFAIGFGVYAAIYNRHYISNQIEFNPDRAIVSLSAEMRYRDKQAGEYTNWSSEILSTFQADNKESSDLSSQIWNKNSSSPIADIDFNEHPSYLMRFNMTLSEARYLYIEGFSPDRNKFEIQIVIKNAGVQELMQEITAETFSVHLQSNNDYTIELIYNIKNYNKSIYFTNNLTFSFLEQLPQS